MKRIYSVILVSLLMLTILSGFVSSQQVVETPPEITIEDPKGEPTISRTWIYVNWTVKDDGSDIDHYKISIDGGGRIDIGSKRTYKFTDLSEGEHNVVLVGYDEEMNSRKEYVNFTVDITDPTLRIVDPDENCDVLSESYGTVRWVANDEVSSIDYYQVKIDDERWEKVEDADHYTFSGVFDGEHTVYVKAVDQGGNTVVESKSFEVNPTDEFVPALWLIGIGLLFVGAVSAIRFGYYVKSRRERKRKKEMTKIKRKK